MYIREAHPFDSNWADRRLKITDPTTQTERNKVAVTCTSALNLTLPTVVDDLKDSVSQKYKAWPERIYVIDTNGRIAYKNGPGPFGFKPDEARKALEKLLTNRKTP